MGVIVPTPPRNIVVCCDGTDNEVATDSTNVLRLFRMLERDGRQLAYYDGGVGTLVDPTAISLVRKYLSRRLDAAIGLRIRENAIAAYRFLSRTYRPGDKIFLFGFSRGAYTVRAVAGLIHFLGLLRPELENLAPLAWAVYANEANAYPVSHRFAGGNRFNRSFGVTPMPPIHCIGAWDTVSSFGWFWNFRTLPHTAVNPSITHFRHALAIDDRRACFPANLYFPQEELQANCKQVWFAGVHADVGGGYPEKEATLAKVSLAWMIREAEASGLLVNAAQRRQYLLDLEGQAGARSLRPDPRIARRLLEGDGVPPAAELERQGEANALAGPAPRPSPANRAGIGVARLGAGADEAAGVFAGESAQGLWRRELSGTSQVRSRRVRGLLIGLLHAPTPSGRPRLGASWAGEPPLSGRRREGGPPRRVSPSVRITMDCEPRTSGFHTPYRTHGDMRRRR